MSHALPSRRNSRAFTLIELLTVIAIIGILAAILIPTVSKVRSAARNTQCVAQLRDWGRIINLYSLDNKGNYYTRRWSSVAINDAPGGKSYQPYFTKAQREGLRMRYCPADPDTETIMATQSQDAGPRYTMIRGWAGGVLAPETQIPLSRAFSPSQYMVMVDSAAIGSDPITAVTATEGITGAPVDLQKFLEPLSKSGYAQRHGNKFNAVFGDGSVKRVGWSTSTSDRTSVFIMRNTWFTLY
jgi:prepilin-type N-terminal cleavage/methylation domain-containing protein/prepilin-type processing-associated H-X9-DG protein